MSGRATTAQYEPRGYCPHCDYRTDTGTCAECGLAIEPHQLRRAPRTWLRRHVRTIAASVVVVLGLAWLAGTRPELTRYLPTCYLLRLHGSDARLAGVAAAELAGRYAAGELTQAQTTRFVRQWADVKWFAESVPATAGRTTGRSAPFLLLHNVFVNRAFPVGFKLPAFTYGESLVRVRIDGTDVEVSARPAPALAILPNSGGCKYVYGLGSFHSVATLAAATGLTKKQGFYASSVAVVPDCAAGFHEVEITTRVVVTELATGRTVAEWPQTHRLRVELKAPAVVSRLLDGRDWQPGLEDLLFPHGRVPGQFSPGEAMIRRR